ncbi:MAG TPA: hypothetical protein DHW39_04550 [Erysipelotrichaceae bacterium]|nr:hypothetical protein [Erysipelotrichaceae bacterium]
MNRQNEKMTALLLHKQTIRSPKLREAMHMSIPEFYDAVREINEEIRAYGTQIRETASGFITIIARDPEGLQALRESISTFTVGQDAGYRIRHIAEHFLSAQDYTRIEDLADEYYVSARQISTDLKEVRKILEKYNIGLQAVPHHGLIIRGSELSRRLCLTGLLLNHVNQNTLTDNFSAEEREQIDQIRSILSSVLEEGECQLSDDSFENLVIQLFINLNRVLSGNEVHLPVYSRSNVQSNEVLAKKITAAMEEAFGVSFSADEENYIMILLQSSRNYNEEQWKEPVPAEIMNLTEEFLQAVDETHGLSLRKDLKLTMILALHILPLISRLRYGLAHDNPMLAEIRSSYIYEFELARTGVSVLEKALRCRISDDETGYIALDIAMSLRQRYAQMKNRILIVCSTGRGTAQLLRMQFSEAFERYIESMDVISARQAEQMDLSGYDFIFTTVPLFVQTAVPVFMINAFLKQTDLREIDDVFREGMDLQTMHQYFSADLFLGRKDLRTKEEIISFMCAHIRSHRNVDPDFQEKVLQREEMASTSFGNMVAFPHPAKAAGDETFVCVLITKEPVLWDSEYVQIVLMTSVARSSGEHRDLQMFYNALGKIVRSEENASRLIKDPYYDTLVQIIFTDD